MKKLIAALLGIAGIFCMVLGGIPQLKQGASISVIGRADGPTSIFLAGRVGDKYSIGLIIAGAAAILTAIVLFLKKRKQN